MAPIHRALVDPSILTDHEIAWIDAYHATVRERVGALVDGEAAKWLDAACAPLKGD